jgi:hypothetical protein
LHLIASNENPLAAIKQSAATIFFLDYLDLPERFARSFIKALRSDKQWKDIKAVIYVSAHRLTKQISEQLVNNGLNEFVFKTSDTKALRKAIADVLK